MCVLARPDNRAVTSLACRNQGHLGKPIFLLREKKRNTDIEQGLYGVGVIVKGSISLASVSTHQLTDKRLMAMRFELAGKSLAVNLVVAHALTRANLHTQMKEDVRKK